LKIELNPQEPSTRDYFPLLIFFFQENVFNCEKFQLGGFLLNNRRVYQFVDPSEYDLINKRKENLDRLKIRYKSGRK
jgi:hypothetical protein